MSLRRSSHWAEMSARKPRSVMAVAAVAAVILAGCAGGAGTSENTETGESADDKVVVTAWVSRSWSNAADGWAAFMEANPNIEVQTEIIDTDDILQRMQRAQDAGQPLPDIIQDDTFMLEAYLAAGLVAPIDDYVADYEATDPDAFAKVLPIVFSEPSIDGQVYGVANAANMDVLYYNVPWLEEACVELPIDTYDEMLEAITAMKASRPSGIPLSVQALAGDGVTTFKTVMIGTGTPFEGSTPDLFSDGAQYTIDFFQKVEAAGGLPPEAIAWGEAEARGGFISGGGLIIDGFTTAGDFIAVDGFDFGEDWAQTLMPTATESGLEGSRPTSSRAWSITTGSANPDAAWEVIKYTTTTEFLIPQVLQGGVPPRNSEAIAAPEVAEFWPFFTAEVMEGYLASVSGPMSLDAGDVEGILELLWGDIVTGADMTPQELAEKYQPLLDELK